MQLERYARHIILPELGGKGQERLLGSSALVVGAGGLGSPLLLYLAAAGVGRIGIVDDDAVNLSNLQRQVIHTTDRIGDPKVESARGVMSGINPEVTVETHGVRLEPGNVMDLIGRYDIVADGSDNFATRYLVNDACYLAKRPLVFAALGPFDGYLTTFRAFDKGPDGKPLPSYRCIFPQAPPPGTVANCSEVGILGAVAGVMGTLQALEVTKEIIGVGDTLAGRLIIYDARSCRFQTVNVAWDPANPLTGENPTITDLSIHTKQPIAEACDA